MIEPDPEDFAESDFTDDHLRFIQSIYGPQVKDALLLPGPVPIEVVGNVIPRISRVFVGAEG